MIDYEIQIILAIVLSLVVGYQWGKLNTLFPLSHISINRNLKK